LSWAFTLRAFGARKNVAVGSFFTKYVVKGGDLYFSTSFDGYKPLRRESFVAADVARRLLLDTSEIKGTEIGFANACPPAA